MQARNIGNLFIRAKHFVTRKKEAWTADPVQRAGLKYNAGNVILMAQPVAAWLTTAVIYGESTALAGVSVLPIVAGGLFMCSGVQYARGDFKVGNRLSTAAATIFGVDLAMHGQPIGAACAIGLHAGGKLVGSFPEFFERQFSRSRHWVVRNTVTRHAKLPP